MLLLEPAYKDYIWGGTKLLTAYGKHAPFSSLAESWELSVHPDGLTHIADGACSGLALRDYLAAHPEAISGADIARFPILVKLIDAKTPLSVQVHPDDAYAQKHADSPGKTELWHILDAEPGAYLYLGLNRAIAKKELKDRIAAGTVEEVLRKVTVHPGETYYIPAGTLHAIGSGVLLCEVQESSNLTYRVYDYGRKDAAGHTRGLHIQEALAVVTPVPVDCTPPGCGERIAGDGWTMETLVRCPYFSMQKLLMDADSQVEVANRRFTHLLCVEGELEARQGASRLRLQKGDGLFIPAGEAVTLTGRAAVLLMQPGA